MKGAGEPRIIRMNGSTIYSFDCDDCTVCVSTDPEEDNFCSVCAKGGAQSGGYIIEIAATTRDGGGGGAICSVCIGWVQKFVEARRIEQVKSN